jgi:hypothetical protein
MTVKLHDGDTSSYKAYIFDNKDLGNVTLQWSIPRSKNEHCGLPGNKASSARETRDLLGAAKRSPYFVRGKIADIPGDIFQVSNSVIGAKPGQGRRRVADCQKLAKVRFGIAHGPEGLGEYTGSILGGAIGLPVSVADDIGSDVIVSTGAAVSALPAAAIRTMQNPASSAVLEHGGLMERKPRRSLRRGFFVRQAASGSCSSGDVTDDFRCRLPDDRLLDRE